jgi:hypothetical protein
MELFGFEFKRKTQVDSQTTSFAPPNDDDGAIIVTPTPAGLARIQRYGPRRRSP